MFTINLEDGREAPSKAIKNKNALNAVAYNYYLIYLFSITVLFYFIIENCNAIYKTLFQVLKLQTCFSYDTYFI